MDPKKDFKAKVKFSLVFTLFVLVMLSAGSTLFAQDNSSANAATEQTSSASTGLGFIAAAIAFGFGALGAGIAIGNVGSAAMGAIAEKPELATQALIFIALGEGLVVFGFVTALMILGKV
jgi:V/A-type H+-transporting ATPase subunit K